MGDAFANNRVAKWSDTRNGHVIFRWMMSQYSMGARLFRVTSISGNRANPLYERGDTTDPDLDLSNAYRQGVINFLKVVENGVYPSAQSPAQIKGVSPVAAVSPSPTASSRYLGMLGNGDFDDYFPAAADYTLNGLIPWDAYTNVPDYDMSSFLWNNSRRGMDTDFGLNSPGGFVPFFAHHSRAEIEALPMINRAYETDLDTWAEFGTLEQGRDTISAEIEAQKTNLLFYVENECFWNFTEQYSDPNTVFGVLMDSKTFTPQQRTVNVKKGKRLEP